ncbi:MAG TPA: PP2C family serine/threonine-protein phosphatase [Acidimicrobiia bacterium]|jgi:protein phosphatase
MNYLWSVASHKGLVRSTNQDAFFPEVAGRGPGPILVIVADGMGGAVAGDVASRLAVEAATKGGATPAEKVARANEAVYQEAMRNPAIAGMGTTMTLAVIAPDGHSMMGHVGDSRAYLLRGGHIQRLTRDHTVVEEYVEAGRISPTEVSSHPQRHMLTRVLGLTRNVPVDATELQLQVGDRLLLCSDGLTVGLEDDQIADLLGTGSPEESVWAMVEAANGAGGIDNVTVLVVDVLP